MTHIYSDEVAKNLTSSIVAKAVNDYMHALRDLENCEANGGCSLDAKRIAGDCESFFKGEWFELISDVDGKRLIGICRKRVKDFMEEANKHMPNKWMFDKRPHFQYTCPICGGTVNQIFARLLSGKKRIQRYELRQRCSSCGFYNAIIVPSKIVYCRSRIGVKNKW